MRSSGIESALIRSALHSFALLATLFNGVALADGLASDRPVSYQYLTTYGRPQAIYALSESHDNDVCPELLSLLNEKFRFSGPQMLSDHIYLLHTRRDVEWREVEAQDNLLGGDWGYFGVAGQPVSDPSRILLHRTSLGGYDVETLYLVKDRALREGSDPQGALTLDFLRALDKDQNEWHAAVSAKDWMKSRPEAQSFGRWDDYYGASVVNLKSGYYALITSNFPFDEREYVRQGLVVLAFRLEWASLRQPICAFVH